MLRNKNTITHKIIEKSSVELQQTVILRGFSSFVRANTEIETNVPEIGTLFLKREKVETIIICVPKVPFHFHDKLKNEIQNTILIFVFNTNNGNGNSIKCVYGRCLLIFNLKLK